MSTPLLDAAIEYVTTYRWRVVPLHHMTMHNGHDVCSCSRGASGECRARAKHPRFPKWQEVATRDPDAVRLWWKHWPRANVGILMGGITNTIAIDIDGGEGRTSLAKLEELHGPLPLTRTQSTGRTDGGTHYLFEVQAPLDCDWMRNRARLAPGIDVRAAGGFIVGAPSVHHSMAHYRWLNDIPIAPLPKWMFTLAISHREQQKHFTRSGARPTEAELEAIDKPLALRIKHARKALLDAAPSIQGQNGSGACLKAAMLLIRGYVVPPEQAHDLLWRNYNSRCIPMWSSDEIQHKVESAEISVDIPWGYRLDAIFDEDLWNDFRPAPTVMVQVPDVLSAGVTRKVARINPDLMQVLPARPIADDRAPRRPAPPAIPGIAILWSASPNVLLPAPQASSQSDGTDDDSDAETEDDETENDEEMTG